MATASFGRTMSEDSLLFWIRADQGRTGTVAATGWQPSGRALMATAFCGWAMLGTSLLSSIRADQGRQGQSPLPGGSRRVGHRWRLRFVVGRCRGLRYYPRSGRTGTVAATEFAAAG